MVSADQKRPHVLIVGAGLGGLTLAQALRKQGVTFEIFEWDKSITSRSAGWAIALHSMLEDLKQSVPEDLPPIETTNHLLPLDLNAQLCFYAWGKKFMVQNSPEHKVIRANRFKLREWLTTNIDIRWNHKPTAIKHDGDQVKLQFADGSEAVGDVLVGADGVSSQVRSHLFQGQDRLHPIEQGTLIGELDVEGEEFQKQLGFGHSAYVFMGGKESHLFVGLNHVNNDGKSGRYYWLLTWEDPNGGTKSHWTQTASKQELYDFAIKQTASIDPKFRAIIEKTSPEGMLAPPIIIRDLILEGLPNTNVTLLGDAAHAMTPFRGEGGSHAMQDGLKLAKALANANKSNLLSQLKGYQDEMLQRSRKAVEASRNVNAGEASEGRQAWGQHFVAVDE